MYRYADGATLRLSSRPVSAAPTQPDIRDVASADSLHSWLTRTWSDPDFAAAVEIASPTLAAHVAALLATRTPCARSLTKAATSTLRYLPRATTRATPFGLFAGVVPLRVGDTTHLEIGHADQAIARVDHRWISDVVAALQRCTGLADRLSVTLDGRAHVRDGRLVLPHRANVTNEVSVRVTAPVDAVLRHARTPIVLRRLPELIAEKFPRAATDAIDRMLTGLMNEGFPRLRTRSAHDMHRSPGARHRHRCPCGRRP